MRPTRRFRTALATFSSFALLATIAATASGGAFAQTALKAADVHPPGYSTVVAVENLGRKFEAATKGKYKLQMFPSSVLGGEKEMIEQAQTSDVRQLQEGPRPARRHLTGRRAGVSAPDRAGMAEM